MIEKFLDNKIKIEKNKKFCCIIGTSPSKGARSPKLWTACFNEFKIKCNFYAFDVSEKNFGILINNLKKDKNFIGGAIAVPYKEKIIKYLDKIDKVSESLGSINIIHNINNNLFGTNTDGLGALQSIKETLKEKSLNFSSIKKTIILGSGGTAKSISVFLSEKLTKIQKFIFIQEIKKKLNI